MRKKSTSKQRTPGKVGNPFQAAIEKGEVKEVRRLISGGQKPDAAAARLAVDACNKAYSVARMKEAPLLGRMPKDKERADAAAAAAAYYEIAEALLAAGAPVPESLCPAARSGNAKLALLLIRHGADVDYDPPMGTPLENAVCSGDLDLVRALIKAGADINHQGIMGTVLTRAISEKQFKVATELIGAGADVNAQPKSKSSALLTAVTDRQSDFVQLLISVGADVNCKGTIICGDFGKPEVSEEGGMRTTHVPNPPFARDATPLIVAARRGWVDIAAQLINAGADLEAVDRDGLTALTYAVKANDQPMIKLLTDAGAKASKYAEGSAKAAFMAASSRGECQRLRELLAEGLDPNVKHAEGEGREQQTALKCAAENGHLEAMRLLLRAGARPDETFGSEYEDARETALMHAASKGQTEAAKALIEAGANPTAKDRGGRTVMHHAAEGGNAETIRLLVKAGAKVDLKSKRSSSPLMEAAGNGHVQAVKALLELGANPDLVSRDGFTPMVHACMSGHTEVVRVLLEAGASPKPVFSGLSPLEMASGEGHKDIVELLLKAGAGSKKRGEKKKTAELEEGGALVSAALMGKVEIVRTLLQAGADPNEVDEEHFTPLMAAVRAASLDMVQMLLQAGADVNALNEDRETALDLARDNIKMAKDQARFLKMLGKDDLDKDTRKAIALIKKAGGEDEITAALQKAGAKRGKELKGVRRPRRVEPEAEPEEESEIELEIPDFSKRSKAAAFQKAIDDLARICGKKPKPVSNEEGQALQGCVRFQVASETADSILQEHHESFLARGCYLFKSERGFTSGKDELTLLPTADRDEVLTAFQTNGANCGIYPAGIIRWLDDLEKDQPFLLTGAGFDWCEGRFTRPLVDSKKLAKKMYEFCPDIVDQGVGDVARLALELKKTQRFFFWWD